MFQAILPMLGRHFKKTPGVVLEIMVPYGSTVPLFARKRAMVAFLGCG
jgi:hypothetical protein